MTSGVTGKPSIGVERVDAITLATHDMARALDFYQLLGAELLYGGAGTTFSSFRVGDMHLNLVLEPEDLQWSFWGRIVFHVEDVDAAYERCLEAGIQPEAAPRDAEWGERYFHVLDPDGHQLSFARPLDLEPKRPGAHRHAMDEVEEASNESFPASDSPTFTPTTGEKRNPSP